MNKKEIKLKFKNEKSELKRTLAEERLSARLRYDEALSESRAEYLTELEAYYADCGKRPPVDPPKRSLLEEIGNSVTHGVGSVLSVIALCFMLAAADRPVEIASAVIYFIGLFAMFTMSCLYHAFPHGSAVKRLFRRFDYTGIYLLIGATFTPPLLCYIGGIFGITFSVAQWAVIVAGITFVGVFGPGRLKFLHVPLYVALGWSALLLLPSMINDCLPMALWILAGGVAYTLGIIPFAIKSKVSHFIWHFFVLAGAVLQWVGIFVYIYLP